MVVVVVGATVVVVVGVRVVVVETSFDEDFVKAKVSPRTATTMTPAVSTTIGGIFGVES
jgi:hypothetical protein